MQKNPRLRFTEEERADPALRKAIKKAEKAADKADRAQAKIPKKKVRKKEKEKKHTTDVPKGKKEVRLHFEEVDRKKPSGKLSHAIKKAPVKAVNTRLQQLQSTEEESAGDDIAQSTMQVRQKGREALKSANHSLKLRPYRKARKAEKKLEKANINALYRMHVREHPIKGVNPMSRFQQKRAIKKQYVKMRAELMGKQAGRMEKGVKAVTKTTTTIFKKVGRVLVANPKVVIGIGGSILAVAMILSCISSCSVMFQSSASSLMASTYPSEDADMLAAEAEYAAKEANLQQELDHYEESHPGYDEYQYELDEIAHDPYVLISILTALHHKFQIDDVQDTLNMLFERQYILTEEVVTEQRDGNKEYRILKVRLKNKDLSHIPSEIMSEEELSFYAMYMKALGNRPDLFPADQYPGIKVPQQYTEYDIPPEALDDRTFAAMIREAEKYLGYPYVWGGSSPSTSFDCSGFVSWVINHSGWNVGRLTASGLLSISTPVSASNAKPGDLIFFIGTYDTPGVSHVGIYVGDGMMIHCGDPISYASINTPYRQKHFYCFARLPGN